MFLGLLFDYRSLKSESSFMKAPITTCLGMSATSHYKQRRVNQALLVATHFIRRQQECMLFIFIYLIWRDAVLDRLAICGCFILLAWESLWPLQNYSGRTDSPCKLASLTFLHWPIIGESWIDLDIWLWRKRIWLFIPCILSFQFGFWNLYPRALFTDFAGIKGVGGTW